MPTSPLAAIAAVGRTSGTLPIPNVPGCAGRARASVAIRVGPAAIRLRPTHDHRAAFIDKTVMSRPHPQESTTAVDPTEPQAATLGEVVLFVAFAVKTHWREAAYAAGAVCVLTAMYVLFAPRKYRSDAQLYVRIGRESVTLDPAATTGETVSVNATRENEINSVVEILSSRGNYAAVIDRLSPEVVLEDAPLELHPFAGDNMSFVSFEPSGPPSGDHQLALTALQKQIEIEAVRRSNIIDASCVAGSPELAQTLLSTYLDAAIERHMRASRSPGSFDFFRTQADDIGSQYEQASVDLSELKSRIGVSSLEERRRTLQAQYSTLETQIATTNASMAESNGLIRGLRERLNDVERTTVATTSGQPQDALGEAERQRNLLAIREQQLLARYTTQHPEVLEVRDQMARADSLLSSATSRKQAVQAVNPTYTQVETQLATQLANLEGYRDRLQSLETERDNVKARLSELNRHDAQIGGLEERVGVLRKASADYTKKLEQARIDRALESERLSNITISQPPTFEPKAVSPQRRLAAVAGLVLALAVGLATALLRATSWFPQRLADAWRLAT